MRVFIFSTIIIRKVSHSKKILRDIAIKINRCPCKVPDILFTF